MNKAEIPTGFPIAINEHVSTLDHGGGPFGDHCGIGAVGVLPFAEHIEIAQADSVEIIGAGKHVGIEFVDVLSDGKGGQGFADLVFHLRQARVVTVGGAGGGVGKVGHVFVFGGHQHVQETVDVGLIGGNRVFDGTRN